MMLRVAAVLPGCVQPGVLAAAVSRPARCSHSRRLNDDVGVGIQGIFQRGAASSRAVLPLNLKGQCWIRSAGLQGRRRRGKSITPGGWSIAISYRAGGIRTLSTTCTTPLVAEISAVWTTASSTVTNSPALDNARWAPFTVLALPFLTSPAMNLPGST